MDALDENGAEGTAGASAATARRLGYAGFAPFALLSLWLYGIAPDHPWRSGTIVLLIAYGALVLSFLGGARWGLALSRPDGGSRRDLILSAVPVLAGWAALLTPVPHAFALLAAAYAAQGAWDSFAAHDGIGPFWYGAIRIRLTLFAVAAMILAFVATS